MLAVYDLDAFKTVNDRHGHDVGDRVLREVSRLVQAVTPQLIHARLGGEVRGGRIRRPSRCGIRRTHTLVSAVAQNGRPRVTASVGVVVVDTADVVVSPRLEDLMTAGCGGPTSRCTRRRDGVGHGVLRRRMNRRGGVRELGPVSARARTRVTTRRGVRVEGAFGERAAEFDRLGRSVEVERADGRARHLDQDVGGQRRELVTRERLLHDVHDRFITAKRPELACGVPCVPDPDRCSAAMASITSSEPPRESPATRSTMDRTKSLSSACDPNPTNARHRVQRSPGRLAGPLNGLLRVGVGRCAVRETTAVVETDTPSEPRSTPMTTSAGAAASGAMGMRVEDAAVDQDPTVTRAG